MRVQNQIIYNLSNEDILLERIIHKIYKKYQDLIKYNLVPILQAYDIDIIAKPIVTGPTKQIYRGYDKDYEPIDFIFYSQNDELYNVKHKRWSLYLDIRYKGRTEQVGIIDLTNSDDLSRSFSLITQTLEDMGFTLREDEKSEEEAEKEEDPDIASLMDYKNSLSESELKDLDKYLLEGDHNE